MRFDSERKERARRTQELKNKDQLDHVLGMSLNKSSMQKFHLPLTHLLWNKINNLSIITGSNDTACIHNNKSLATENVAEGTLSQGKDFNSMLSTPRIETVRDNSLIEDSYVALLPKWSHDTAKINRRQTEDEKGKKKREEIFSKSMLDLPAKQSL